MWAKQTRNVSNGHLDGIFIAASSVLSMNISHTKATTVYFFVTHKHYPPLDAKIRSDICPRT